MLKKERKYLFILFLVCTFILACYFGQYIINNLPQQYGTDIRPQWFPFYEEFRNLMSNFIHNKSLPFYSWSTFLGTNFFASKSYYLMGDLFSYLGLLFNTEFFQTAFILEIIKFYIAAYSMYYLLSQYKIKPLIKVIGSICFSFSGWAIFFSGQLVFHSFYALVPLYFAGLEFILQRKKPFLFIISTALCLFTNFYFFFTLSFFTVIYYLYRYYILNENFKSFVKDTIITISYYLVGVMITMILTLPTIYYILGNDRLGTFKEGIFFLNPQVYMHELISMFVPNYLYIYNYNVFETNFHYSREICMYGGLISVILLPLIISFKNKISKATIAVWILFLAIMIFPRFGSIIHGFGDPSFRWTFFLIFFNIITSSYILDNMDSINKRLLTNCCTSFIVLLLIIIPITAFIIKQPLELYMNQWILFSIFALGIFCYYLIIVFKPKHVLLFLLIFTTIELTLSGYTLYKNKLNEISITENYDFISKVSHVLQDYDGQLNETLNNIEPINSNQYYRVYVPHESLYWSYSHNMSILYQLNGTMGYDSTYSPALNDLKSLEPNIRDFESEWIFNIKDMDLLNFLNVKYAIVTDEGELPIGGNWRLLSDNFRYSLLIYRNDDYRELGTTYSKIDLLSNYTDSKSLQDTLYVHERDFKTIFSYLTESNQAILENIKYFNNQLTGTVKSDNSSFMVITLPYDAGWKVKINGVLVPTYNVNGGFIGIPINAGNNQIEMYFTPQGFKVGAIISGLAIIIFCFIILLNLKRKKA